MKSFKEKISEAVDEDMLRIYITMLFGVLMGLIVGGVSLGFSKYMKSDQPNNKPEKINAGYLRLPLNNGWYFYPSDMVENNPMRQITTEYGPTYYYTNNGVRFMFTCSNSDKPSLVMFENGQKKNVYLINPKDVITTVDKNIQVYAPQLSPTDKLELFQPTHSNNWLSDSTSSVIDSEGLEMVVLSGKYNLPKYVNVPPIGGRGIIYQDNPCNLYV